MGKELYIFSFMLCSLFLCTRAGKHLYSLLYGYIYAKMCTLYPASILYTLYHTLCTLYSVLSTLYSAGEGLKCYSEVEGDEVTRCEERRGYRTCFTKYDSSK